MIDESTPLAVRVVDRAQVVEEARAHWQAHPAPGSEHLRFEAGDLRASIPPATDARDVYLLPAVLHGFDDEFGRTA